MENQTLNEFTGLPEVPEVSPITGLPSVKRVSPGPGVQLQSQFNPQYRDPIASYQEYGAPLSPFLDLEEERAKRQSTGEKWFNGTAKMITTAGGAFVDGTAGLVAGIIQSVGQWDKSKFYDNVIGNNVDSMNEWMQNNFPNYYTKEEQEAVGLASLGYANFWADKTLNGVGYLAGMIGSTATVAGGVRLAGKALSNGLKAHRFTKAAVTGVDDAVKAITKGPGLAPAIDATKNAFIGFTSAFAEASVEARETLRRKEQELLEQAAAATGVEVKDLDAQTKLDAKEEAKAVANTAFALNSMVVGLGNVVAYRALLNPRYFDARRGFGRGITKNQKTKLYESTVDQLSPTKRALINFGKPMGRGAVVESFQESTQFAIQEGAAEDTLQFLRETSIPFMRSGTEGALSQAIDAWGEAYATTFSTKEGLDSTMVGAIVGILGGGGGAVRRHYLKPGRESQKREKELRTKLVDMLNDPEMFNYMQKAASLDSQIDIAARMSQALEQGDHKTYRDLQAVLVMKQALLAADGGRLDLFMEKLDEELAKDEQTFREHYGIPDSVDSLDKNKLVNGIKNDILRFVELRDNFDARFSPPVAPGARADKEEIAEHLAQLQDFNDLRSNALQYAFEIEDGGTRTTSLMSELNELGEYKSDKGIITEEDLEGDPKALRDKLERGLKRVKRRKPHAAPDYATKAIDLIRINEKNKQLVQTVNDLYASPESRSAALERQRIREDAIAQQQRDEQARERLANARTEKDLRDIVSTEENPLSAEVKHEIAKRKKEVSDLARDIQTESAYLSVAELKRKYNDEEDAMTKSIYSKIIEARTRNGQLDPLLTRAEPKAEPKTKPKKKKKKEEKPAEEAPPAEEEVGPAEDVPGEEDAIKEDPSEDAPPTEAEIAAALAEEQGEKGPSALEELTGKKKKKKKKTEFEATTIDELEDEVNMSLAGNLQASGLGKTKDLDVVDVGRPVGLLNDEGKYSKTQEEAAQEYIDTMELFLERGASWEQFSKFALRQLGLTTTASMGINLKTFYNQRLQNAQRGTSPATKEEQQQRHLENRKKSGAVSVANGELSTERGTYNVIVNENGETSTGNDINQQDVNGVPLPINRQIIKDTPIEDLQNMKVTFKVLETKWSSENETTSDNVPIGIYLQVGADTVLIGMVPSASATQPIAEERKNIVNGEDVVGRIKGVRAGNIVTTVNEAGERVFFSIAEAVEGMEDVTIAAMNNKGRVRLSAEMQNNEEEADKVDEIFGIQTDPKEGIRAGRVVIVSPRPGFGYGIKAAATAQMDSQAVGAIEALLQQDTSTIVESIREIVGFSNDQNPDTTIYIQQEPFANATVYFKHANGDVVRIFNTDMAKALKGEPFVFSVGKFVEKKETVGEEEIPVTDSEGNVRYTFKSKFNPYEEGLSKEEQTAMRKEMSIYQNKMKEAFLSSFRKALLDKRRQVSIEEAYANAPYTSKVTGQSYDSYLEYLSDPNELETPQGDKLSILTVDGKAHNGSFYYDLGIEIDIFESDSELTGEVAAPKPKMDTRNAQPKPPADITSLLSPASKAAKRKRPAGQAKKKGEQNKKDCK